MAGTSWLVALVLITTTTAQAQYAPGQAAPPPYPPAQAAPPPYPPGQVAPAQPPPAALAPAQDIYAPAATSGALVLPPYPGYPPTVFSSATQAADYNAWRLERLTARQRALTQAGRPENYHAQQGGGFALIAAGSAMTLGVFFYALYNDPPGSSSEHDDIDNAREIGMLSAALFGIGLALGGVFWLSHLKHSNPYRREIQALDQERGRVSRELKRARQQARAEQRLSFDLSRLQVKF